MYELINVTGNTYYIESPAKIGLVKINDNEVVLIDSGNDKEAGKKALRHIEANGWKLIAVYNTHSNADHIGGNAFLQSKTDCKIYAPEIECSFTRHPMLESSLLFGGYPLPQLRHKFLMAQESNALPLTKEALPDGFEIIPLYGHFLDMVGYRTPDGAVFLADCLSSRTTLDKYKFGYVYDVRAYLETLETVKEMQGKVFIPSHAEVTEDIKDLAQYNIDAVNRNLDLICELCIEPVTSETLLKRIFEQCSLTMTFEQHALVGSTLRCYLAFLTEKRRITPFIESNELFYKTQS